MLVTEILKAKGDLVFTIGPDETVAQAASRLHERRVGALVVVGGASDVKGILSERDVVRAVARGSGAALEQLVSGVMTREVIFADPRETIDSLLTRMTDRRIRHLPVVDGGRLIGLVSIGDLVKAKIAETVEEAQSLKAYIAAG
jgi:CBS domain-containing protein